MKYYVFVTADIYAMGGMQSYVSAKTKYLEQNGWKVKILYPGHCEDKNTFYGNLGRYREGGFWCLKYPPFYFSNKRIQKEIDRIISYIRCDDDDYIIIESQNDVFSFWGEILAERLKCKNFCFICNEQFRGKGKYYQGNLEFFEFKLKRGELAFIHENSVNLLFEGWKSIDDGKKYVLVAANDIEVIDYNYPILNNIDHQKINICYFGRVDKGYLPYICKNVKEYAAANIEKQFRFLIVGDGKDVNAEKELAEHPSNLEIKRMAGFFPIPKRLFELCNVVIASSGCAVIAGNEGKKVIIPDSKTGEALGVYGYTMKSWLFNDQKYKYCDLLDDIIFNDVYCGQPKYAIENLNSQKSFQEHFEYLKKSNSCKQYYVEFIKCKNDYSNKTKYDRILFGLAGNWLYTKIFSFITTLKHHKKKHETK